MVLGVTITTLAALVEVGVKVGMGVGMGVGVGVGMGIGMGVGARVAVGVVVVVVGLAVVGVEEEAAAAVHSSAMLRSSLAMLACKVRYSSSKYGTCKKK